MSHFFALLSTPFLITLKPRISKKWKKLLEISLFYTCVPKTTIIWDTVTETRSERLKFFVILGHVCHLASGYVIILHICTKNHNHMMYAFWDISATDVILLSFFTLLPHYWPRKLKFGKNVEKQQEILSFYKCAP